MLMLGIAVPLHKTGARNPPENNMTTRQQMASENTNISISICWWSAPPYIYYVKDNKR